MENSQNNHKTHQALNQGKGQSNKGMNDVLTAAEREILQMVSEFYVRFSGGQVKTGRKDS